MAETKTESLTKTLVVPLDSSNRKNERLRECIGEYQEIIGHLADVFISFPEYKWSGHSGQLYRVGKEHFPNRSIHSQALNEATQRVVSAYDSWKSNGKPGNPPKGDFGYHDYIEFTTQGKEISKENSVFGIKVSLEPYKPEWFRIRADERAREILDKCVGDDHSHSCGSIQIRYNDGNPMLHATVSEDIEVYKRGVEDNIIGVDIGERILYAACCYGETETATMESGKEFREKREALKRKRQQFQEQGKLREVKKCKGEHMRYTDYVTHRASREVVDFASEHTPAAIALENLTHYRQSRDPIHDWPFAELQEKISYKATEAGIPVVFVNPEYTSQKCRKCGELENASRDKDDFLCHKCGYEVHADINAGFNIAKRGAK